MALSPELASWSWILNVYQATGPPLHPNTWALGVDNPGLASGFRTYQPPKVGKLPHSPNTPCLYK